jgi:hypothetical protein
MIMSLLISTKHCRFHEITLGDQTWTRTLTSKAFRCQESYSKVSASANATPRWSFADTIGSQFVGHSILT